MTRFLVRTLCAVAGLGLAGWASAVTPGEVAPDFQLPGQREPIQLSALRGKLVYLDFWASWCGPCKQSFPWMNELQSRLGGKGLQVVGVNLDARTEDGRRFLQETPAHFPIAFDAQGATPRQYAITGMPTSVLIGPDGKVLLVHRGFHADERAELEATINRYLPK